MAYFKRMENAGGDAASATITTTTTTTTTTAAAAAAGDSSGALADDLVRPVEMPDEEEYRWGAF